MPAVTIADRTTTDVTSDSGRHTAGLAASCRHGALSASDGRSSIHPLWTESDHEGRPRTRIRPARCEVCRRVTSVDAPAGGGQTAMRPAIRPYSIAVAAQAPACQVV